jgi:tRNA pseudouridine13 synthase
MTVNAHLIPGSEHFIVTEEAAYLPVGTGEHLYVDIEKENLTTDMLAEALAKCCGKSPRDVGYAGRKDRHAITHQWFSIHFGKEEALSGLTAHLPASSRVKIHAVSRHSNKIRLGHLAGNHFSLGIAHAPSDLAERLAHIGTHGIENYYGPQRFGIAGASLIIAQAWGSGQYEKAVERMVDPHGSWAWGQPVPEGFRHGPEGRVVGALRHGASAEKALRSAGDVLTKLIASTAQSAIFNAIVTARKNNGVLHTLRVGDIGCTSFGAPFLLKAEELAETNARVKLLQAFTTAPMPGQQRLVPAPEIEAEERAWSADTHMDWSWFNKDGVFASPGERRPCLIAFRTLPTMVQESDRTVLSFALPAGAYATTVLEQLGIAVPEQRGKI